MEKYVILLPSGNYVKSPVTYQLNAVETNFANAYRFTHDEARSFVWRVPWCNGEILPVHVEIQLFAN
jgi:hypothetical protein